MNDASDAIPKAVALNKKHAASLLVRKEKLEAELARVQAEGGSVEALTTELAATERELTAARAEIAELRRLATQSEPLAGIATLGESDGLTPSLEESALDRARQGIGELEAQADLGDALSGATPAKKKPSREEAEEQARQEFEALREQSTKPAKKTM